MRTCHEIRPLLLEAEPEALAGHGEGPVATHVRACSSCAAAAGVLLEETASLDRYLAGPEAAPDVDAILEAALGPGDEATVEGTGAKRAIPFPTWRRWAGLAAAAAVAGLFLMRTDAPPPNPIQRVAQTPPLVEAAPDQDVAVLETANPDITVLWFF